MYLSNFMNSNRFLDNPDVSMVISTFSAPSNTLDYYAQRLTAFIQVQNTLTSRACFHQVTHMTSRACFHQVTHMTSRACFHQATRMTSHACFHQVTHMTSRACFHQVTHMTLRACFHQLTRMTSQMCFYRFMELWNRFGISNESDIVTDHVNDLLI